MRDVDTPLERLLIPAEFQPRDGRFGCGPSRIRPEAVEGLADRGAALLGTSHRKPPVKALVGRLQNGLRELFAAPDGYEVVLGNGGATALWDAAAFALVEQRSLHYSFGEFSAKFAAATRNAPWLDEPVVVDAEPGTRPSLRSVDGVDVQALTHNETSTGVMMEIRRPQDDALVLVDATSGAGGLPVDVSETDVYYFSLQKGFASDGGLWVALCSPAAIERIERLAGERYVPASLDLAVAVDNARKQQTYNTPAIATLWLASDQIEWLLERGGLAWAASDCAAKAAHVYGWAEEREYLRPFVTDADARSNVVATVDVEGVSADDINRVLRSNGIVDTDAYRKLGRNQLRIGLFPAVDRSDVLAYTAAVDWIVGRLAS